MHGTIKKSLKRVSKGVRCHRGMLNPSCAALFSSTTQVTLKLNYCDVEGQKDDLNLKKQSKCIMYL